MCKRILQWNTTVEYSELEDTTMDYSVIEDITVKYSGLEDIQWNKVC